MARPPTRPPTGWSPTVWPWRTTLGPSGSQLRAPGTKGAAAAPAGTAAAGPGATTAALRRLYSRKTSRQVVGLAAASVESPSSWSLLLGNATPACTAVPRDLRVVYADSMVGNSHPRAPPSSFPSTSIFLPVDLTGRCAG